VSGAGVLLAFTLGFMAGEYRTERRWVWKLKREIQQQLKEF